MKRCHHLAKPNNLKALRKKNGITQNKLGGVCRQSPSRISEYELGKVMPSDKVLYCMERFFDVPKEEIYPEIKKMNEALNEHVDKHKETVKKIFMVESQRREGL